MVLRRHLGTPRSLGPVVRDSHLHTVASAQEQARIWLCRLSLSINNLRLLVFSSLQGGQFCSAFWKPALPFSCSSSNRSSKKNSPGQAHSLSARNDLFPESFRPLIAFCGGNTHFALDGGSSWGDEFLLSPEFPRVLPKSEGERPAAC